MRPKKRQTLLLGRLSMVRKKTFSAVRSSRWFLLSTSGTLKRLLRFVCHERRVSVQHQRPWDILRSLGKGEFWAHRHRQAVEQWDTDEGQHFFTGSRLTFHLLELPNSCNEGLKPREPGMGS